MNKKYFIVGIGLVIAGLAGNAFAQTAANPNQKAQDDFVNQYSMPLPYPPTATEEQTPPDTTSSTSAPPTNIAQTYASQITPNQPVPTANAPAQPTTQTPATTNTQPQQPNQQTPQQTSTYKPPTSIWDKMQTPTIKSQVQSGIESGHYNIYQ